MTATGNQCNRFVAVAAVNGLLVDLRSARRQQVVAQALGEVRLAGRKSALRRRAVVQLLPVVGNVGIGGVAHDVIVEEDEQEAMSLRVDLVDEQAAEVDRAPHRAQEVARQNHDRHLRMRTGNERHVIWRHFTVSKLLLVAALCNRAGHYIFALWFLSSVFYLSFFFPRLISAAAGWMSTIL